MKEKATIIFFLLLSLTLAALAQPSPPHRVYGNITEDGAGAANVNVTFRHQSSVVAQDLTDSGGFYDVEIPYSGSYSGEKIYLFTNGRNTSEFINFTSGGSERLNYAGDFSNGASLDASFTYSVSDMTVSVDASSSSGATSYSWDWNSNGTYTDSGVTSSHTYSSDGTYTINLRVSDGFTTDTVSKSVTVPQSTGGSGGSGGGGGSSGGSSGGSLGGGGGFTLPDEGSNSEDDNKTLVKSLDFRFNQSNSTSNSFEIGSLEDGQRVEISISNSVVTGFSFVSGSDTESAKLVVKEFDERPESVEELGEGPVFSFFNVQLKNVEEFRNGVLGYKVSKSWLNKNNRSSSDIILENYDGTTWNRLDSSLESQTIVSYMMSSPTEVLGTFAAATESEEEIVKVPSIFVKKLNITSVEGDKYRAEAVIANQGRAKGSKNIYLYKESTALGNVSVDLEPGETTSETLEFELSEPGVYSISMGSVSKQVEVKSGPNLFLIGIGVGVFLLITGLIIWIYIRETRKAKELEKKIQGIERQGEDVDRSISNLQNNLNNLQRRLNNSRNNGRNRNNYDSRYDEEG